MILLLTDFGGSYAGQMQAALYQAGATVPVIDLHHDLACFEPRPAAYLLAAYARFYPAGSVFAAVVDPGVGSASRKPVAIQADGRWLVGPDNGLFHALSGSDIRAWEIVWQPPHLSNTFHGRDLFAPVAARLSNGDSSGLLPLPGWRRETWPADLWEIIYIDHYGNLFSGVRASSVPQDAVITLRGHRLRHARAYSDAGGETGFWHENSIGLLEIAVNRGNAARALGVKIGAAVAVSSR